MRKHAAIAQFAGGVPAMCDGVTQGQPGMELSLFSRDVIAISTAIALTHDVHDGAMLLGVCDKIVPGLLIGALSLVNCRQFLFLRARCRVVCRTRKKAIFASCTRKEKSNQPHCLKLKWPLITAKAPAHYGSQQQPVAALSDGADGPRCCVCATE